MRVELPAPLNPIEWHAPEDVPLLGESDHPYLHFHHDEHICMDHHADFEVAAFPATPLLPSVEEVHDDDFSDFVESPASEVPPEVKTKAVGKEASAGELVNLFSFEYIQHVAIILTVQLLIPIPFMIPMGINFMKRALKVFIPGFALGLVGHSVYNVTQSLNAESAPQYSIVHSLPSPSSFIPSLFAQLKVGALGGIIIGAGMAHILNLIILGHTLCRLVRRLEPEPTLMRRAMDSSKTFQRTRRVLLDVITGVGMMPAGVVGRRLCFGLMGKVVAPVDFSLWHSSMIGLVGALAIQLLVLSRPKSASAVKSPVKS